MIDYNSESKYWGLLSVDKRIKLLNSAMEEVDFSQHPVFQKKHTE